MWKVSVIKLIIFLEQHVPRCSLFLYYSTAIYQQINSLQNKNCGRKKFVHLVSVNWVVPVLRYVTADLNSFSTSTMFSVRLWAEERLLCRSLRTSRNYRFTYKSVWEMEFSVWCWIRYFVELSLMFIGLSASVTWVRERGRGNFSAGAPEDAGMVMGE